MSKTHTQIWTRKQKKSKKKKEKLNCSKQYILNPIKEGNFSESNRGIKGKPQRQILNAAEKEDINVISRPGAFKD